jgi:hypothetical protein
MKDHNADPDCIVKDKSWVYVSDTYKAFPQMENTFVSVRHIPNFYLLRDRNILIQVYILYRIKERRPGYIPSIFILVSLGDR